MENEMIDKAINIWTIALKDIGEAFRNKLAVSILLAAVFMLLMPKWLGSMLSPPTNEVLVFEPGNNEAAEILENHGYQVVTVNGEDELAAAVQRGVAGMGLAFQEDFSFGQETSDRSIVHGYITWSDRGQIPQWEADFRQVLGENVEINFDDYLLYPNQQNFSMLGLSFLTMLVVMFMVGISLVPGLIFEEKQTKTLDALLVSPAGEGQLTAAKALVGLFYTLLVAAMLFGLNWNSVVHWELTIVFTLMCGLFSVSIGLVIGSFYERQQDVSGLLSALLIVFVGTIFVDLVQLDVPDFVGSILAWLPSNWLFRLLQTVFFQSYTWGELVPGLISVLGTAITLFGVVVWRLRQRDRQ